MRLSPVPHPNLLYSCDMTHFQSKPILCSAAGFEVCSQLANLPQQSSKISASVIAHNHKVCRLDDIGQAFDALAAVTTLGSKESILCYHALATDRNLQTPIWRPQCTDLKCHGSGQVRFATCSESSVFSTTPAVPASKASSITRASAALLTMPSKRAGLSCERTHSFYRSCCWH